jgi:pimeloyl-ACP methyl ester carboxylesterase
MVTRATTAISPDGSRFDVIDEGSGPPILIVHPGGGTSSSWTQVARLLAHRFRVLRFDRRPYRQGDGARPAEVMTGEVADVLTVAAFVDQPVLLVGHASGAVVALEAALAGPSQFVGLVLYEPPVAVTAPLGGEALVRAEAALDDGKPDQAMKIHLREIVEVPGYLVRLLPVVRPLWRQMSAFGPGQISDDLALESLGVGIDRYRGIDLPVLLLGGSRSPKHLRIRLDALADVLPRLDSVIILKGQGHLANARAPGPLAQIIESFANRLAT